MSEMTTSQDQDQDQDTDSQDQDKTMTPHCQHSCYFYGYCAKIHFDHLHYVTMSSIPIHVFNLKMA